MSKVLVVPNISASIDKLERMLRLKKILRADRIILFDVFGTESDFFLLREFWKHLRSAMIVDTTIVPLIGENELGYITDEFKKCRCPRFKEWIGNSLAEDQRFLPCYSFEGVFYSYAGISTAWLRSGRLMHENSIRYRLGSNCGPSIIEGYLMKFTTWEPYTRRNSCMCISFDELTKSAPSKVCQVVGRDTCQVPFNAGRLYSTNSIDDSLVLLVSDGDPRIVDVDFFV